MGECFVVIFNFVLAAFRTNKSLRLLIYSEAQNAHRIAVNVMAENAGEHTSSLVVSTVNLNF